MALPGRDLAFMATALLAGLRLSELIGVNLHPSTAASADAASNDRQSAARSARSRSKNRYTRSFSATQPAGGRASPA
jgi:hypothetical protein